jgi:HEPN domain-containing protein
MNRVEFQRLSDERLEDAAVLFEAGRHSAAYYMSGYAIECALKACVSRRTIADEFPPRDAAKYYTHDLTKLLDLAGLGSAFTTHAANDPGLQANWAAVKDWTEESRYLPRDRENAKQML